MPTREQLLALTDELRRLKANGQPMKWLSAPAVSIVLIAAGPAFAHQWLDYFEYGRSELSARGYETARGVARYAADHPDRYKIVVTAHLDTAEAAEFSPELAVQRAQSMASELARLGVDPGRVEIRGMGATQLARATGPNVRESLNRRLVVDVNLPDPT